MIYLSFVKLYFSSTFNYVQFNYINLNINVSALPSAPHVRLQNRQCHAFLQERIQKAVQWLKNSHLERARPKNCASIHPRKKWRRSPKKINLLISDAPEIKRVSCLCFPSEHTDATLKCHSMCVVKRHHTHNSVFYFCFIFFPSITTSIL